MGLNSLHGLRNKRRKNKQNHEGNKRSASTVITNSDNNPIIIITKTLKKNIIKNKEKSYLIGVDIYSLILNLLRQSLADELEFCFSRNGDFHFLSTVASFSFRYSLVAFHLSEKPTLTGKFML